jgi:hypothetical protein
MVQAVTVFIIKSMLDFIGVSLFAKQNKNNRPAKTAVFIKFKINSVYDPKKCQERPAGLPGGAVFCAYASNGVLCDIEHFPALLPSTARTHSLAASFQGRAVEARNGVPVTADRLVKCKPAAVSAIAALICEIGAAL